jgi:hypothetical protein
VTLETETAWAEDFKPKGTGKEYLDFKTKNKIHR